MTAAFILFLTIFCAIQLIYLFVLLSGLKESKSTKAQISVSVIIAARNEAHHLHALIAALSRQKHPNYEVILVNDRSTDESYDLLQSYSESHWLKVIHLKVIPDGWNGKKYALSQAIKMAKNNILLFTDADCLPNSDHWISSMTEAVSDKIKVVLGFSPYQKEASLINNFIQFETLLTGIQYLGMAHLGFPYMSVGRNWAIQKAAYPLEYLNSIKNITGGDDDLIAQKVCNGVNTEVRFQANSQTTSEAKTTWKSLIHQKIRHLKVGQAYSKKSKTLLGLFSFSYVISWLIFLVLIVSQQWSTALLIFCIRSLSFYIIFIRIGQKLDTRLPLWALPLIDFCYPFWYTFLGVRSLAAKQIEWKPENSFLIKH